MKRSGLCLASMTSSISYYQVFIIVSFNFIFYLFCLFIRQVLIINSDISTSVRRSGSARLQGDLSLPFSHHSLHPTPVSHPVPWPPYLGDVLIEPLQPG